MIYEYAIEPQLLAEPEMCGRLADSFGIWRGRMLSRFPEHWRNLVDRVLADANPVQKMRIYEALKRLTRHQVDRFCRWDNACPEWLVNAEREHARQPFRAILATRNPAQHEHVLLRDDLSDTQPLWHVETNAPVPRVAREMANCAVGLFECAKEALFVDQYFRPDAARFRRPLEAFLERLQHRTSTAKLRRVEYHTTHRAIAHLSRGQCERRMADIVPTGMPFRMVVWEPHHEFHNRYILTNQGGIQYATGLDDGAGQDDVTLLSESTHGVRWRQFQRATSPFVHRDEIPVMGRKR